MCNLKPCPFCGKELTFTLESDDIEPNGRFMGMHFKLYCPYCNATLSEESGVLSVHFDDNGDISFTKDDKKERKVHIYETAGGATSHVQEN